MSKIINALIRATRKIELRLQQALADQVVKAKAEVDEATARYKASRDAARDHAEEVAKVA